MIRRNPCFSYSQKSYLFSEIGRKAAAFRANFPQRRLANLSIGDTTLPLSRSVTKAIERQCRELSQECTYRGYGPEQGCCLLRQDLVRRFYRGLISPEEMFISDGAKCDLFRLQSFLGPKRSIAVQNPTYPVYAAGSIFAGSGAGAEKDSSPCPKLQLLPCTPENNFFPELPQQTPPEVLYFCSPNNPTGVAASYAELQEIVRYCTKKKVLLVYDSAYAAFINQPNYPKTIFEIPGAKHTAIEVGSFSKIAGFTGLRLGWTVVPQELRYLCGNSMLEDWRTFYATTFNGASCLTQCAGRAVLSHNGWSETKKLLSTYLERAKRLRETLRQAGHRVCGGIDSPYIWLSVPKAKTSLEWFDYLLSRWGLMTTPGSGFGSAGEGFLRLSCFAKQEDIAHAQRVLPEALQTVA